MVINLKRFLLRRCVVMGFTQQLQTSLFLGLLLGIVYVSLVGVPFFSEENNCNFPGNRNAKDISHLEDDYEPIINLQNKPKSSSPNTRKRNVNVIRPRYYSTELNIKEKLLVIVLSNDYQKYGKALNDTLSNYADKIIYFVKDDITKIKTEKLDNVYFLDLEKSYFKLKRTLNSHASSYSDSAKVALLALKFVIEHQLKNYQYFYFIKDSTYVHGARLREFIESLSFSDQIHVGHVINSVQGESRCYLESGILLSHNVLAKATSQETIDWCSQYQREVETNFTLDIFQDSMVFEHCILKATNLPCSYQTKNQIYLSLNLSEITPQMGLVKLWESGSIAAFPVSSYEKHIRLTKYLRQRELKDVYDRISTLEQKLNAASREISSEQVNRDEARIYNSWPIGVQKSFLPTNRFDVNQWAYFNRTHVLLEDDFGIATALFGVNRIDMEDVLESCKKVAKKHNPNAELVEYVGGYRRFDPTRGMEYLLDLTFLENGNLVSTRYQSLRPLSKTEMISVPYVTEHTRIVLALPVWSSNLDKAAQFVLEYANVCLKKKDNSVLVLLLLHNQEQPKEDENDPDKENEPFYSLKSLANNFTEKYHSSNARIAWMSIYLKTNLNDNFISDLAVLDLLVRKLTPDSLVLLCRSNMELRLEYLNRVRMNTIHGTQVFSPIPFTQFHPNLAVGYKNFRKEEPTFKAPVIEIKNGQGRFDQENFDHISFYVFDYLTSRKALEKEIPSAKVMKDLQKSLYYKMSLPGLKEMFLKARLVHLMRAIEPDLRLYHNNIDCYGDVSVFLKTEDESLKEEKQRIQSCVSRNWRNLGTKSAIASVLLGNRNSHNSSAKEDYSDTE